MGTPKKTEPAPRLFPTEVCDWLLALQAADQVCAATNNPTFKVSDVQRLEAALHDIYTVLYDSRPTPYRS